MCEQNEAIGPSFILLLSVLDFPAIPMGSTPLCMMSVDDVGEVVRQLFLQGKTYLHKTISVCGDKITTREIVSVLNRALSPKCIQDKQVKQTAERLSLMNLFSPLLQ